MLYTNQDILEQAAVVLKKVNVFFQHIKREFNCIADKLSRQPFLLRSQQQKNEREEKRTKRMLIDSTVNVNEDQQSKELLTEIHVEEDLSVNRMIIDCRYDCNNENESIEKAYLYDNQVE